MPASLHEYAFRVGHVRLALLHPEGDSHTDNTHRQNLAGIGVDEIVSLQCAIGPTPLASWLARALAWVRRVEIVQACLCPPGSR